MSSTSEPQSLYFRDGDYLVPTAFTRGPWDPNSQHGGAPAALLVTLAESTVEEPGWAVVRLTLELMRPVPLAPLTVVTESGRGRTVRRVTLMLCHEDKPVARAVVLLQRQEALVIPAPAGDCPLPLPQECSESAWAKGMPEEERSFHCTAMEMRRAAGTVADLGPAAVWFRLTVPVLPDTPLSGAARAAAAGDFGNGISSVLPFDSFLFTNPDLTVYLHRSPRGEWVCADSETTIEPTGIGLSRTTLYDEHGRIGLAQQDLVVRRRT